jgi:hypothetical protein
VRRLEERVEELESKRKEAKAQQDSTSAKFEVGLVRQ